MSITVKGTNEAPSEREMAVLSLLTLALEAAADRNGIPTIWDAKAGQLTLLTTLVDERLQEFYDLGTSE